MFISKWIILILGGILLPIIIYKLLSRQKPYTPPYDQETEKERFEKKRKYFTENRENKWEKMEDLKDDQKEFMNHFLNL